MEYAPPLPRRHQPLQESWRVDCSEFAVCATHTTRASDRANQHDDWTAAASDSAASTPAALLSARPRAHGTTTCTTTVDSTITSTRSEPQHNTISIPHRQQTRRVHRIALLHQLSTLDRLIHAAKARIQVICMHMRSIMITFESISRVIELELANSRSMALVRDRAADLVDFKIRKSMYAMAKSREGDR